MPPVLGTLTAIVVMRVPLFVSLGTASHRQYNGAVPRLG
jgi:hypothetical protein